MSREEGIGPALMVGLASSEAGALFLLAQNGAESSADEAIEDTEQSWRGMLEIAKPSPKHRVKITDDPLEAIATAAASQASHLVLERLQALLTDQPAPRLKPVAEEIEPLSRLAAVADPCLVWMQGQTIGRDPRLDLAQGGQGLCFRPAQDHKVISVAHHLPPTLLHQEVERMQIEVGEQWRDHCPLGRSRRRPPARHVLHDVLLEEALDQRQNRPVTDRALDPGHQPVVRDAVEITLQVGVHHPGQPRLQQPIDFPQRVLATTSRAEAVAARPELRFKDRLDDHLESRLHDPVLDRRDPQRTGSPVAFGDLHPFDRVRPVAASLQTVLEFLQIPLGLCREPFDALPVHPGRPLVARDFLPRRCQGRRSNDLVHQTVPLASFDAVAQRRHHALGPDRCFRPPPLTAAAGFCPCVAFSGTPEAACCLIPDSAPPTSCPPSLGAVLLPALFTAYRGSGTTKAVTPADLTRPAGLSAYSALPSRPVALPVASAPSVASRLRHERAGSPQTYAESGSSSPACAGAGSTDCRFTSGCSPPRLTATQLPSITEPATGSGA